MEERGNKSEVARVMRQIELECEAKHQFITARMENIGRYHGRMKELVGEQEAGRAVAQALERAGDENETTPEKVEKSGKKKKQGEKGAAGQ